MINKLSKRVIIFVILNTGLLYSQTKYKAIDAKAKAVHAFENAEDLSAKLTKGYKNDLQKARSIFYWITENIRYDTKEYHSDSSTSYYTKIKKRLENKDSGSYNHIYNNSVVDTVLKRKAAICDGYARLFKTLCHFAGVKSEVITGMGKSNLKSMDKYVSNHAWNCVYITDKWLLLDVCWASGVCDTGITEFKKERDEFYFLTEPKYFSYSHYPDFPAHFYYNNPIAKAQFLALPIVYSDFFKLGFDSFSPINGSVVAKKNDKFQITLSKLYPEKTSEFSSTDSLTFKKSEIKYYLEQKINNPASRELIIFYGNNSILNYKLQSK